MNRITHYLPDDELFSIDDLGESMFAFDGRDLDRDLDRGALRNNQLRYFDPTPGLWLDESPVGYEGQAENVTPYVGQ